MRPLLISDFTVLALTLSGTCAAPRRNVFYAGVRKYYCLSSFLLFLVKGPSNIVPSRQCGLAWIPYPVFGWCRQYLLQRSWVHLVWKECIYGGMMGKVVRCCNLCLFASALRVVPSFDFASKSQRLFEPRINSKSLANRLHSSGNAHALLSKRVNPQQSRTCAVAMAAI